MTPDAKTKTRFVIVDAIGVCESDKTNSKPLDRKPNVPLDKLLNSVAAGMVNADIVSALASRLARLEQQVDEVQAQDIEQTSGTPGGLPTLSANLLQSIDPDQNAARAARKFKLPEGQEPTEAQMDKVEREAMAEALKPFHNPRLRESVLRAKASTEQVIDEASRDGLLRVGFDAAAKDKARTMMSDFRKFIEDHKDEIEAIKVLYSRPHRAGLRYRHVRDLAAKLDIPPFFITPKQPDTVGRLWAAYELVEPDKIKVKGVGGKSLVDLIALVRHAITPADPLEPVAITVEKNYLRWLAEQNAAGVGYTTEHRKWLDAIKDHIAKSHAIEQEDFEDVPFSQFGGLGKAHELFGDRLPLILNELNERLAA